MSIPGYRPKRHNPTAARVRRAALLAWTNPTRAPSLHSLWAAIVCYCGIAKCQCCQWASDMDEHWISMDQLISWLLKQNRDPTWYYTYLTMVELPFIYDQYPNIYCHKWSSCADQHLWVVILRYMYMLWPLGKQWCQRERLPIPSTVWNWLVVFNVVMFNHVLDDYAQ